MTTMEDRKQYTRKLLAAHKIESNTEDKRDIENEIIVLNEALCASVAWKFRDSPIEIDDAMQVARMAMMKAIRTYNGKHQFSTHAVTVMRNDILNVLDLGQRSKRKHNNLSIDKPFSDGKLFAEVMANNVDVENHSTDRILIAKIFKAVPTLLTKMEYQAFLFAIDYTDHDSNKSFATELGVAVTYVTTLKRKALKKVRKKFSYEM